MTLRPLELAQVTEELAGELHHQPVQKVIEQDERTVLFGFPRRWLLICVAPRWGRLHLLDERPAGRGQTATAFCMLLRKLFVGARLESARSVEGERAAVLTFARVDGPRQLRVFLYGAAAHLDLVDENENLLGRLGGRKNQPATPLPPLQSMADALPSRFDNGAPSSAIAAYYQAAEERARLDARLAQARAAIKRQLDRLRRLSDNLAQDIQHAQEATDLRRDADLIMAHLAEIPRGAHEVMLPDDFTDGTPCRIALNPAYAPRVYAARLYHEHKRLARGRLVMEKRRHETLQTIATLENKLSLLDEKNLPPDDKKSLPAARFRPRESLPYHVYFAANGDEIWVGRNARDNDQLTFHFAHGEDLWLHARDFPGSHVVVPRRHKTPLSEETLLDAATLALHHSNARGENQVDITYAFCKYIRKLTGGAPGQVTIARGKTLHLRHETSRLARLWASRQQT